jgi:hypothetical protein
MYSIIWRRDIMTKRLRHRRWWHVIKWLRHSLRGRRNRRSRDIAKFWCRWRRQMRMIMMGTPLTVYFMVLNCMTW